MICADHFSKTPKGEPTAYARPQCESFNLPYKGHTFDLQPSTFRPSTYSDHTYSVKNILHRSANGEYDVELRHLVAMERSTTHIAPTTWPAEPEPVLPQCSFGKTLKFDELVDSHPFPYCMMQTPQQQD